MSAADRSSMYKAKSNRSRQNTEIIQKNRVRRDKRQTQYNDNRPIVQSPEQTTEQPSQVKQNRQKIFREKFANYLKKKAEDKLKKKPKPFVPAGAVGKCFDAIAAPAVKTSPKKKTKQAPIELKDLMSKDVKADKPTNGLTVNIYERQFVFTRSRAKAEVLKAETKPPVAVVKEKIEKVVKPKAVVAKKIKPQPVVAAPKMVKPSTSTAIKKSTTKITKTTEIKAKKPSTAASSKTPQSKQVAKTDKPQSTETNPRTSIITSTVLKPKKHSTINDIFNQSTSPIDPKADDDVPPPIVPKVAELKKQNNPQNTCFVSPCVKLMKGKLNSESKKDKATSSSDKTPEAHSSGFGSGISYLSPFVTISRGGRTSSRKEKKVRESKYVLESRKSLDFNQSIEDRQRMEAAAYFRLQVKQQTDLFNNLIAKWQNIIAENGDAIPSECIDSINVAIGQTQLLTTSKFKQFSNLVTKFEGADGEQKILAEDLEGFWSMVFIQVENCNQRFERLETLKNNDWEDPELNVVKQKKLRRQNAMVTKPKKTAKANSALTKMLLEVRKNLKESKAKPLASQSPNMVITPAKKLRNRLSVASSGKKATPKTATPSKPVWIIEDTEPKMTPMRGILKTPASCRKQMRITFKTSPQVKLFEKENSSPENRQKSS